MKGAIVFCFVIAAAGVNAQVEPAKKVIQLLTADQKKQATFVVTDQERLNWNFVPVERRGLSIGNLNEEQKKAVHDLLAVCLSKQGFTKATSIPTLEGILREVEGRGESDGYRDPKKYFISFFGKPETHGAWHWRFEGHHLSLNFSVLDGAVISATPSFMGANPAVVPSGRKKGWEVLEEESLLAFQFMQSLTPSQQKAAIFSDKALPEIITGNSLDVKILEPKGLSYKDLTSDQRISFVLLMDVYIKNYDLGFSSKLWDRIQKAGMDNLTFAWAGATTRGGGTYYRIQGPMLQIEYDNTQTNANHVHTAIRDLTNDFAKDVLREHYKKEH